LVAQEHLRQTAPNRWILRAAETLLTHRRLPVFLAFLAVALTLPALGGGWTLDDYYHRVVLLETPAYRDLFGPPDEMFRFFRGDPVRTAAVMDLGFFPWWTYPGLKAEFCQPLTVLTHRFDYWLWPNSPALMHAHSLLWFGTLVAVVTCLYRRLFGPTWVAGVAGLLFALDDAHGTPAGFLANRNVLVAGVFGVLALIAHDAWRREGRRWGMLLAPVLLGASLFAKEEGIATCAYLAAYSLWLDRAGWRRGCLALIPSVAVVLLWATLRAHWGYGVHDMGLYVDPLTEPGAFATAAAQRLPILLLGQWAVPPSDVTALLGPAGRTILWCAGVAFLLLLCFAVAPLLRRDPLARFWATGMVLAAAPVCATFPMDRLLTFVGIGAFGLLAQFWSLLFARSGLRPQSTAWRIPAATLGWSFVVIHLVFAPLVLPFRAAYPTGPKQIVDRFYVRAALPPSVADQTVVIVNAPSPLHACLLPLLRTLDGMPAPRHTRVLAPALPRVTVRRLDDRTLSIRPERGYLSWILDQLFRGEHQPLALGQKVALTGMTVEITALTEDDRPAEATFQFDRSLEDASLYWLCYRENGFEPFTPPAVGESVEIRIGGLLR
jgi:hypothetical protein